MQITPARLFTVVWACCTAYILYVIFREMGVGDGLIALIRMFAFIAVVIVGMSILFLALFFVWAMLRKLCGRPS
jgi:hypothetical protein